VANALAITLLPAEQARLANVRTVDPEAYDAYLKGIRAHRTLTKAGLEMAEQYFDTALKEDPTFAVAWAGIARVWTGRQQMSIVPPAAAAPQAKAAILKALALDENTWEAQRVLAAIMTWTDWDWPAAERAWTKVLALNPNDADTLAVHSHYLMHMGRTDEAVREGARAVELDPFSPWVWSFYAQLLLSERRYDDAIAAAHAARRLQADAPVATTALLAALFMKGRHEEELALQKQGWARRDRPELVAALERGAAEEGYTGAYRRLADVLTGRFGKPGGTSAYTLAVLYVRAGDKDRALEWLERAYDERDPNMPYMRQPYWDFLRPTRASTTCCGA